MLFVSMNRNSWRITRRHDGSRKPGRARLTDKKIYERRQSKQNAEYDGGAEKRLLQTAAGVEAGREVVGSECTANRRPRALQYYGDDNERRECELHVGQDSLEENHRGEWYQTRAIKSKWETLAKGERFLYIESPRGIAIYCKERKFAL